MTTIPDIRATGRGPLEPLPEGSPFIRPPFDIGPFRHMYPWQGRWLMRHDQVLHYLDEGSGEPLVLLHGNPTWSFYYRRLIQALAPRCRLIVPDHMGCGLSSRPDDAAFSYTLQSHADNLEDLLDRLDLQEGVTLVLHDWGGMIGMACACRRPERIARLIVLNTGAFLIPPAKRLPWPLWFIKRTPLLPALLVRGLNAFSLGAAYLGTKKSLPPEIRRAYTAPYGSWQNRIATLRFVEDIPVTPRDRSYGLSAWVDQHLGLFRETPMQICWGERDFVFDRVILAEWTRRFPGAEVQTYPEAGHYILEDAPGPVLEKIVDFLDRHPL
jgi:cis-3-alkyl-4-acyloxetan-2-one decarboxylase